MTAMDGGNVDFAGAKINPFILNIKKPRWRRAQRGFDKGLMQCP